MSGLELFQGVLTFFILFIVFMLFFFIRKSNRLKAELNKVQNNQKKLLEQIGTTTKTIKDTNEFLNQQFQQAHSFVQETLKSFENMKGGMEFQTKVAPSLQTVANSLYVKTEEILKTVKDEFSKEHSVFKQALTNAMTELNGMMDHLKKDFAQLQEKQQKMKELHRLHEALQMKVSLTKDLSEHINLLVMNATIESSIGNKALGIPMSLKEVETLSSQLYESILMTEEEINLVQNLTNSLDKSLLQEKEQLQTIQVVLLNLEEQFEKGMGEEGLTKRLHQMELDLNEVLISTEEITEGVEKINRIVTDQIEDKANIYHSIESMHQVLNELFDAYKEMNSSISDFEYAVHRFEQSS